MKPQANNVVEFANLLLSKHEETMKQREIKRNQSHSNEN